MIAAARKEHPHKSCRALHVFSCVLHFAPSRASATISRRTELPLHVCVQNGEHSCSGGIPVTTSHFSASHCSAFSIKRSALSVQRANSFLCVALQSSRSISFAPSACASASCCILPTPLDLVSLLHCYERAGRLRSLWNPSRAACLGSLARLRRFDSFVVQFSSTLRARLLCCALCALCLQYCSTLASRSGSR